MKCPVCQKIITMIWFDQRKTLSEQYGKLLGPVDGMLYQISYPGQKEYLSPRCSECLDKVLRRR